MSAPLGAESVTIDTAVASRRHVVWRVIGRERSAVLGALVLAGFILIGLLVPAISPYGPREQVGPPFEPPSSRHWLGLDDGGVDVVALLTWGARVALVVGFGATSIAMVLGVAMGIAAGYRGGWIDGLLMRITDYFLVIPAVPLMIIVAALWGSTLTNMILIIGLLSWTGPARVIRAQVKSVRERVYVKRATSLGAGHGRIIFRHILPPIGPLIVANTAITIGGAIFFEAALSFLGLGDPNHESWGKMIDHAFRRAAISEDAWWAIVPPGMCIAVLILACSLLGRALEDALNPRLASSHLAARRFRIRSASLDPR